MCFIEEGRPYLHTDSATDGLRSQTKKRKNQLSTSHLSLTVDAV